MKIARIDHFLFSMDVILYLTKRGVQMKKILLLLLTISMFYGCITNKELSPGRKVSITLESAAIGKSFLDENTAQDVTVYLPPGYDENRSTRYPVIYFLHGFGNENTEVSSSYRRISGAIIEKEVQPFIVVEPNGKNSLGGSFFRNSPSIGNWEDFVVDELIEYIDNNYKTIAKRESRGIAGFSMGGTGAINIGLSHPDKFAGMYAFSAGLLKDGDMGALLRSWGEGVAGTYHKAYGAACSPNLEGDLVYEIPNFTYEDGDENDRVIDNWYTLFGDMDSKLDKYLEMDYSLKGIRLNSRVDDSYKWIYSGTKDLSELMTAKGISHEFEDEKGDHRMPSDFAVKNLFPFFEEVLETN